MERIAIIENELVKNIVVGDSDFASEYDGTAIILTDDNIDIGYTYKDKKFVAPEKPAEDKELEARQWRDSELKLTDFIVPTTDYPKHAEWLTYREELRDWPSTENFPDTKPSKP